MNIRSLSWVQNCGIVYPTFLIPFKNFLPSKENFRCSYCLFQIHLLYIRYPIVARALDLAAAVQPLGRVRARAKVSCIQIHLQLEATLQPTQIPFYAGEMTMKHLLHGVVTPDGSIDDQMNRTQQRQVACVQETSSYKKHPKSWF